ncbi:MAG: hypothetical protein Q8M02_14220 [Candidatus Didemnitutus sp.]|nr:hypothetical protein [Candidatus Didemnitutus sp.]
MTNPRTRFTTILACLAVAVAAHAKVSETISRTYPFNADGVISLSNINGEVEIIAWDRHEVSLEAEKIASHQEGLQRMTILIEHTPALLVIKTELEKKWKFWRTARTEVRYKLRVPAGASLQKVGVVNSRIIVRGVRGFVNLDSINGSIIADGLATGGRFDTINGSITVSFAALDASSRVVLDTVNGSCTVKFPESTAFSLAADTINGSITCEFPLTITKKSRRTLRGDVNGGGPRVVLDAVNGNLNVRRTSS